MQYVQSKHTVFVVYKGSWSLGLVAGTCVLTFAETFMIFSVPHLCTNTALVVAFTTNGKICVLKSPLSKISNLDCIFGNPRFQYAASYCFHARYVW